MVDWLTESIVMNCTVAQAHGILTPEQVERFEKWDAVAMCRHALGRPLDEWEVMDAADARADELASDGLIKPVENGLWDPVEASRAAKNMLSGTILFHLLEFSDTTPNAVAERAVYNAIDAARADSSSGVFDRIVRSAQNAEGFAAIISLISKCEK